MSREKPYEVVQGKDGTFVAAGNEPIDSPAIALRMTSSMYKKLDVVALKNKAQWIRVAIQEKLEHDHHPAKVTAGVEAIDDRAITIKKSRPYEVVQGEDGTFVAAGNEPIDSPAIALRMTSSMYEQLVAVAGKNKAQWIRQAIQEKLEHKHNVPAAIAAVQGEDGTFAFSLPSSMYEKLDTVAGKDKAQWIREAIQRRLEQDYPQT